MRNTDNQQVTKSAPCAHEKLLFGSGDYYIFCQDCPARWCIHNPILPEYEYGPNGKLRVGADASMCSHAVTIRERVISNKNYKSKWYCSCGHVNATTVTLTVTHCAQCENVRQSLGETYTSEDKQNASQN